MLRTVNIVPPPPHTHTTPNAQEFVSHCAPDDPQDAPPTKLTCDGLRSRLRALNLDTRGTKASLVTRLEAALKWAAADGGSGSAAVGAEGSRGAAEEAAAAAAVAGAGKASPRKRGSKRSSKEQQVGTVGGEGAGEGGGLGVATPSPAPRKRQRQQAAAAAAGDGQDGPAAAASAGAGSSRQSRKRRQQQQPPQQQEEEVSPLGEVSPGEVEDLTLSSGSGDEVDLAEELLSRQLGGESGRACLAGWWLGEGPCRHILVGEEGSGACCLFGPCVTEHRQLQEEMCHVSVHGLKHLV
jgi:hypothetical protein